jgi:hypothetical protein
VTLPGVTAERRKPVEESKHSSVSGPSNLVGEDPPRRGSRPAAPGSVATILSQTEATTLEQSRIAKLVDDGHDASSTTIDPTFHYYSTTDSVSDGEHPGLPAPLRQITIENPSSDRKDADRIAFECQICFRITSANTQKAWRYAYIDCRKLVRVKAG